MKNRQTIFVFDCDGVILDSNRMKSEAFYYVARKYTTNENANKLVQYNKLRGGVSRYHKFRHFHEQILGLSYDEEKIRVYIEEFGNFCRTNLTKVPEVAGIRDFLENCNRYCYVVSGADENELRIIFDQRKLSQYFREIFGTPKTKLENLLCLSAQGVRLEGSTFFGDSRVDYEAATECDMKFVFVYGVSEFDTWQQFFEHRKVLLVKNFEGLQSNKIDEMYNASNYQ